MQLHAGPRAFFAGGSRAACSRSRAAPRGGPYPAARPSPFVAHLPPIPLSPPFRQGCSLYKACNATTREHVGADPTICDPFQQLATLCAHDTGMGGMGGCRAHYNSMCAKGSRVPQCAKSPGFELMTTADANKRVRGGRRAGKHERAG